MISTIHIPSDHAPTRTLQVIDTPDGVTIDIHQPPAPPQRLVLPAEVVQALALAIARQNPTAFRTTAPAAYDLAVERLRQIETEGWTPEHDDQHTGGELAQAAGCYAMFAAASDASRAATDLPGSLSTLGKPIKGWAAFLQLWPFDRSWWKPTTRRRDLIKAAALILAEIDRLDRAAAKSERPE